MNRNDGKRLDFDMCEPINVKGVLIGEGKPKICIPIMGTNMKEITREAQKVNTYPVDLIEWRVDFFENYEDSAAVAEGLEKISEICRKPIIFTLRSKREGGNADVTVEQYMAFQEEHMGSPCIDIFDIEVLTGYEEAKELVRKIHEHGKIAIVSYHDFQKTPDTEVMLELLSRMDQSGADILKLAVMPNDRKDVMALLNVTVDMGAMTHKPLITMSMGKAGVLSRLIGEMTGSAITFAIGEKASAPGQISAGVLEQVLDLLHGTV